MPLVPLMDGIPNLSLMLDEGVTIVLAAPSNLNRAGGTLTLDADATPPVVSDIKAKDIVISEIMWGLDENAATFPAQTAQQFIEFYNTVDTYAADAAC